MVALAHTKTDEIGKKANQRVFKWKFTDVIKLPRYRWKHEKF